MRHAWFLVFLVACGSSSSGAASSSSSSSSGSTTGSRDPIDPTTKCYFTGDVTAAGITDVIRANGCGTASGSAGVTMFGMNETRLVNAPYQNLQIQFYLDEPIGPGKTGPIKVKNAKLFLSKDGVSSSWISTACTVEITTNDGVAGDGGPAPFRATGKGSCAGDFTPNDEKTTGTGSVGPFELMFEAKS